MFSEELKNKFAEHIKLRAYDDKYIACQEEKEILEFGVNEGLSVDESLSVITRVCQDENYVLERDINTRAEEMLRQFASNNGNIDKKEFFDAVEIVKSMSKGFLSEPNCQKKVKEIILENNWKIRDGFLKGGNWFKNI